MNCPFGDSGETSGPRETLGCRLRGGVWPNYDWIALMPIGDNKPRSSLLKFEGAGNKHVLVTTLYVAYLPSTMSST